MWLNIPNIFNIQMLKNCYKLFIPNKKIILSFRSFQLKYQAKYLKVYSAYTDRPRVSPKVKNFRIILYTLVFTQHKSELVILTQFLTKYTKVIIFTNKTHFFQQFFFVHLTVFVMVS